MLAQFFMRYFQHEQYRTNPQEDQETIDKIDQEYYDDIDCSLYELEVCLILDWFSLIHLLYLTGSSIL